MWFVMLFEENSSQSIVKMKIDLKTDFQVSQPLPPTEITKNQVNKQSSKQIQHIGKTFDHCYPFHYIYLEFMLINRNLLLSCWHAFGVVTIPMHENMLHV